MAPLAEKGKLISDFYLFYYILQEGAAELAAPRFMVFGVVHVTK